MKISKIKSDPFAPGSRYIKISGSNFDGIIYDDGSGSFSICIRGEEILCMENDLFKHKLKHIKETISKREKELAIIKDVYKEVSKINIKNIFSKTTQKS